MARELGVCWDTVMAAVAEHGQPLIDDPERVGQVRQLGIDETSFLSATKDHPTLFATGLVDLKRRAVIDVVPGNSASDLGSWLDRRPEPWLAGIRVVATDLAESYRAALDGRLAGAIRVADPFHVTRLANRCLDQVRRRVQNQTLGHRGRKADPLYRIRKLMVTGAERLDECGLDRMLLGIRLGDPEDEVLGAWLASVPDLSLSCRPPGARRPDPRLTRAPARARLTSGPGGPAAGPRLLCSGSVAARRGRVGPFSTGESGSAFSR